MKLLGKLNAILIIFCLTIFTTLATEKKFESEIDYYDDAYSANDMFLKSLEDKNGISNKKEDEDEDDTADEDNSFLEASATNHEEDDDGKSKPKNKKAVTKPKNKKADTKTKKTQPKSKANSKKGPTKSIKKGIITFIFIKNNFTAVIPKKNSVPRSNNLPKLVELPNKRIPKEDQKLITYRKCSDKTGYLKLVRNPSKLPAELDLFKIYVSLNLKALSLFLDSTYKSLFNTIKIEKILRISQQQLLKGHNCFDVIQNDVENSKVLVKGPITLCANSQNEMNDWINSILEFKECQINVENVVHNNKMLIDFSKVNELLKSGSGSTAETPIKTKIKSLYYDNTNKAVNPSPVRVEREIMIKKMMSNILSTIKKGNMKRNQVQRKFANKLKEAQTFSKELHKKQEIIKEIIQKRISKEHEREEQLVKLEQKHKELSLLKAVQKKIEEMKKKEIKQYSTQFKSQIRQEKQKADVEARKMMTTIVDQNKFTAYDDCTDSKLLFFKNGEYVNKTCKVYYGENLEKECRIKENFCRMCCAHHVGQKFYNKLIECKHRCSDLLIGIDWSNADQNAKQKTNSGDSKKPGKNIRKGKKNKGKKDNKINKTTERNSSNTKQLTKDISKELMSPANKALFQNKNKQPNKN